MRRRYTVDQEQEEKIINDLAQFIHRVALDKNASPAEVAALPEIAKLLFWLGPPDE